MQQNGFFEADNYDRKIDFSFESHNDVSSCLKIIAQGVTRESIQDSFPGLFPTLESMKEMVKEKDPCLTESASATLKEIEDDEFGDLNSMEGERRPLDLTGGLTFSNFKDKIKLKEPLSLHKS